MNPFSYYSRGCVLQPHLAWEQAGLTKNNWKKSILEEKTMIKIAIVDDEKKALALECDCVGKAVYEKGEAEIFPFSSAEEVAENINQGVEYDVLITDIELSGMSGIELGELVCGKLHKCYLIFLTSHSEFALESYKLEAHQYVLKEEMGERLPSIMERLIEKIKREKNNFVLLGPENERRKVYYRDIIYVQKDKGMKYVLYVTKAGNFREREGLRKVMSKLDSKMFLFADRSYIVNMKFIEQIKGDTIYIEGNRRLIVAQARLKKVKEHINRYWGCD